jgi:hypothetical protein
VAESLEPPRCLLRYLVLCLAVLILPVVLLAGASWAESGCAGMYSLLDQAGALRSVGDYDQAISILQEIMTQCSTSDAFMRRAYNEMVFTFLEKADSASAKSAAIEAVTHFPDLEADPASYPAQVGRIYDELRREMFGALAITTQPESCRVFLDGEFIGQSPVNLALVPVGSHLVSASRSGYKDASVETLIAPSVSSNIPMALEKARGTTWWVWRIGPSVLAGTAIAIASGRGNNGSAESGPLPYPPDPPE